jgi:hypothetical protein
MEIYEGRKEVDQLDDLDDLISDPDEMRMQVRFTFKDAIHVVEF